MDNITPAVLDKLMSGICPNCSCDDIEYVAEGYDLSHQVHDTYTCNACGAQWERTRNRLTREVAR